MLNRLIFFVLLPRHANTAKMGFFQYLSKTMKTYPEIIPVVGATAVAVGMYVQCWHKISAYYVKGLVEFDHILFLVRHGSLAWEGIWTTLMQVYWQVAREYIFR